MIKTQVVDRTAEKVALAKELGLEIWARNREQEVKEIELLTSMTFPITTNEKMDKVLEKRIFRALYHEEGLSAFFGWLAIGIVLATIFGPLSAAMVHSSIRGWEVVRILFGVPATLAILSAAFSSFPKCERQTVDLRLWRDNLPYGALLAVKEAQARGLSNFQVHYPQLERRRVMTDPIITATKSGYNVTFEIFAWDDGKIYE